MLIKSSLPVTLLAVCLGAPTYLAAQDVPVVSVIRVDVHGKPSDYLKALKPVLERGRELNPDANTRVSEAIQAGEDTGAILIATRHSSMMALAERQGLGSGDAELSKRMEALEATGRTVISRSLLADRTPSYLGDQEPIVGKDTVAEIVTVELDEDLQDYIASLEPLLGRAKEIGGQSEVRIYQATFAGEDTGRVYVVVRYPSLEAWAKGNKAQTDEKFQKHLAEVAATGRVIISRSLVIDRTPE